MCLTMFSRTTMASSMSNPIASDNASNVIVLMVKLNSHMAKNAEITDTGSVRPVITVDRQLFRNR